MDWKALLAYITGSVDQELLLRNTYLATENRILRNQIQGRGFCRKVRFLGKIQKLGVRNSMTYRVPNARKSNFATEPSSPSAVPAACRRHRKETSSPGSSASLERATPHAGVASAWRRHTFGQTQSA